MRIQTCAAEEEVGGCGCKRVLLKKRSEDADSNVCC